MKKYEYHSIGKMVSAPNDVEIINHNFDVFAQVVNKNSSRLSLGMCLSLGLGLIFCCKYIKQKEKIRTLENRIDNLELARELEKGEEGDM